MGHFEPFLSLHKGFWLLRPTILTLFHSKPYPSCSATVSSSFHFSEELSKGDINIMLGCWRDNKFTQFQNITSKVICTTDFSLVPVWKPFLCCWAVNTPSARLISYDTFFFWTLPLSVPSVVNTVETSCDRSTAQIQTPKFTKVELAAITFIAVL